MYYRFLYLVVVFLEFTSLIAITNETRHFHHHKKHKRSIYEIHHLINAEFDKEFPEYSIDTSNKKTLIDRHLRCTIEPPIEAATHYIQKDRWRNIAHHREVYVHSPCLWTYRLGNLLGSLFKT